MTHDQLFKELLSHFFDDFLHLAVPGIARHLDTGSCRPLPTELFTDLPAGEQRRLDLLAEVPTRSGAPPGKVYVHTEIESEARLTMGGRMRDYWHLLALKKFRPVVPIVVYLRGGPAGVGSSVLEEDLFGTDLSTFRLFGFGLSRSDAEGYIQSDRPLAWALAALMRPPAGWSRVEHRIRCELPIHRSEDLTDAERFLLRNCVATYLQLTESETKEHEMLSKYYGTFDPFETNMTWADWVQMHARKEGLDEGLELGRQQGRRQGREEGLETGMRSVVLRQMDQKLGPLSDEVRQRVEALSNGQIEELALRVLDAESLDDLELG